MPDHATSEIASGRRPGMDAMVQFSGESCKHPWPPLIKMNEAVKARVEKLFKS